MPKQDRQRAHLARLQRARGRHGAAVVALRVEPGHEAMRLPPKHLVQVDARLLAGYYLRAQRVLSAIRPLQTIQMQCFKHMRPIMGAKVRTRPLLPGLLIRPRVKALAAELRGWLV